MHTRTHRAALLAAIPLALALAPALDADTLTERFERTVTVPPGAEIRLRNTNGPVEIRTWGESTVEIVAERKVRARDGEAARQALDAIEIRVEETGGDLAIETHLPRSSTGVMSWLFGGHVDASVSYELRVPASARLDVVTVNGSVHSSGPEGDQTLRSTNGRISVVAAHGSIDARTTNGSIDLELVRAGSDATFEAATTNGSISLSVPADLRGSLEARTINGSVRSDIPVTLHGGASKRRLSADLNGGGAARIDLRTTNGSIRIRGS